MLSFKGALISVDCSCFGLLFATAIESRELLTAPRNARLRLAVVERIQNYGSYQFQGYDEHNMSIFYYKLEISINLLSGQVSNTLPTKHYHRSFFPRSLPGNLASLLHM